MFFLQVTSISDPYNVLGKVRFLSGCSPEVHQGSGTVLQCYLAHAKAKGHLKKTRVKREKGDKIPASSHHSTERWSRAMHPQHGSIFSGGRAETLSEFFNGENLSMKNPPGARCFEYR